MNTSYQTDHTFYLFSFRLTWAAVCLFTFCQCSESPMDILSGTDENREVNAFTSDDHDPPKLPGGALYEISLPDDNNWKDLVIYAHGYVSAYEELALPEDSIEGRPASEIVNDLGMAYATTSFRANGLIGPEAVEDLEQLVDVFAELHRMPDHIYLVGFSQGAMITTLAVEQHPDVFSGGMAGCGPVGNFSKQVNYLGDFHVLFNHFFPDLFLGNPSGIPITVIENWLTDGSSLKEEVRNAMAEDPEAARKLLRVGDVPVQNDSDGGEIESVIFNVLRYNILGTNNAIERLNGSPFDNSKRVYQGTGSVQGDSILNRKISRFQADASATVTIENEFETAGELSRPLITMHTTGDEEVPYWHIPGYREKIRGLSSRLYHSNLRVSRYGHCNFSLPEVLAGFAALVAKSTLQDLVVPVSIFPDKVAEQEFLELSREQGVNPVIKPDPTSVYPLK